MPPKNKKESPQSLLFEEGIERLEAIIERMESERIPLNELMKDYEEGTKLLSLCRNHIDGARQKVEKINKELANGAVVLESLDENDTPNPEDDDA